MLAKEVVYWLNFVGLSLRVFFYAGYSPTPTPQSCLRLRCLSRPQSSVALQDTGASRPLFTSSQSLGFKLQRWLQVLHLNILVTGPWDKREVLGEDVIVLKFNY
ncbi:hypothetical protein K1719_014333 [Acacia pycnantha]|nr:hypothetical protein K1719_014333 [Acacia pycnantha]